MYKTSGVGMNGRIELLLAALEDSLPVESPASTVSIHRHATDQPLSLRSQGTFAYLVVSGTVQISHPQGVTEYLPGHYFLSSVSKNTPSSPLAIAGPTGHVGLQVELPPEDVVAVLLEMDVNFTTKVLAHSAAAPTAAQEHLTFIDTLLRLMQLQPAKASAFIRKHLKRELAYELITGPHGNAFVQDVIRSHDAQDIYSMNDWIKHNYRSVFAVDDLAEQLNMSVSNFHKKFKAAVGMGPLQCQKQLRLSEARRLMLNERLNVTEAAMEVGYESLSQFSREYKKMFGHTAQDDIKQLRNRLRP
jgi:AraC-like DNA-binding protein